MIQSTIPFSRITSAAAATAPTLIAPRLHSQTARPTTPPISATESPARAMVGQA